LRAVWNSWDIERFAAYSNSSFFMTWNRLEGVMIV